MRAKRQICFPITSRAYYGRSQLLIRKLHAHPDIDLKLMLGGSILLDKYSRHIADDIDAGGFDIAASLFNVIEGGNHVAMAKTACLTALEFTNSFCTASPDVVVICGDRFEQLAIAMAAAYLNITIAHIEGGDVTGSIDESVRHAITKLAHLHFVTNADAHRRVLAMGEDPALRVQHRLARRRAGRARQHRRSRASRSTRSASATTSTSSSRS